jgi:hypothetical protein
MVNSFVLSAYYVAVSTATVAGVVRFKRLDTAMRIIVYLMLATSVCEMFSFAMRTMKDYPLRYSVFHIYAVVEILLQSLFFIYAIQPRKYRRLITAGAVVWPAIGMLNVLFLQSFGALNTNMLMVESFSTITMSLYFIYWFIKNDQVILLYRHPHIRIAALLLLLWSSAFFFWAFVKILYSNHWPYYNLIDQTSTTINTLVYSGIALTFLLYPKKHKTYENR